jgi:hypothetical protein
MKIKKCKSGIRKRLNLCLYKRYDNKNSDYIHTIEKFFSYYMIDIVSINIKYIQKRSKITNSLYTIKIYTVIFLEPHWRYPVKWIGTNNNKIMRYKN